MIEVVDSNNLEQLLPLVRLYQEFYGVASISDQKNREFFAQFGPNQPGGCQFLYQDGQAAAFATVYFTFASTIPAKVGVMNDLFTLPEHRGKGIAKQLIQHCHDYALAQGAHRLQWLTAKDNTAAQAVYDNLEVRKSEWYFYALHR